jgi:hypothetical protein
MLSRVALVRTDVSEELSSSIFWVKRICEIGTALAVTSNWRTLRRSTKSETSVLTRTTPRNIPEHSILHSHRGEKLKSYMFSLIYKEIY